MTISAGILFWRRIDNNTNLEFFLCTPGGPLFLNKECWNFPKGQMEEGESPFECAVREFSEETSATISPLKELYTYHGLISQRKDKSVHVYSKEWSGEELNENCKSNLFQFTDGNYYPEIGAYKWMTFDEMKKRGGISAYYPLFSSLLKYNSSYYDIQNVKR